MRSSSGPLRRRRWRREVGRACSGTASSAVAARARVRSRATSMKRVGKSAARWRADDRDAAVLERLAQRLERVRANSEQLVEEQHAVVGELTSPGRGGAPPPTRPAAEIVWCGARNGRAVTSAAPREQARDRRGSRVTSSASAARQRREDRRQPRGPASSCRCPAGPRAAGCARPPRRSRARGPRAAGRGRRRRSGSRPTTPVGWAPAAGGGGQRPRRRAERRRTASTRRSTPATSIALDQRRLAGARARRATRRSSPRARAPRRTASAPRHGRSSPPSASSPNTASVSSCSRRELPAGGEHAARERAGRSRARPCAGTPGARLTVMRAPGTRSRSSRSPSGRARAPRAPPCRPGRRS